MTPLEELRSALALTDKKLAIGPFGDATEMKRAADNLERSFGLGRAPDHGLIVKTLQKFLQTGLLSGYREIKTACYGLLLPIRGTVSIAGELRALESLLTFVDEYQNEPKKLKRCFQAVMNAYFALDGYDLASQSHAQWLTLRQRLSSWLPKLADLEPPPEWLGAALRHKTLFGESPTEEFGAQVIHGDSAEFERACVQLVVPQNSWVRHRVIISAIVAATEERAPVFLSHLERSLELLAANPAVRNEGLAILLNRYVQMEATPEHILLRTAAVEAFGNPLIVANKPRWFGVSAEAQEMVATWLKGFLIERFFELLSHDGRTDKRRPKFWASHRGSIENMWFVLGPSAMGSWNDDFKKLRNAMGNQCLSLDGSSPGNNAFVMKLGNLYVVEFGEKGNAAFLFDQSNLPFNLSARRLEQRQLKGDEREERLLHMDGNVKWESKFSRTLARYGIRPDASRSISTTARTQPSTAANAQATGETILRDVRKFCSERGIRYDDRAPSGRIEVYTQLNNSAISKQLSQWGFYFDKGRLRWVKRP